MSDERLNDTARLRAENARLRDQLSKYERLLPDWSEHAGEAPIDNLIRCMFATIPDGMLITRADDGTIIDINESFRKLLGYSKEDTIGKTTGDINLWCNPDDRDRFLTDLGRRGAVDDFVCPLRTKDGVQVSVLIHAALFVFNDTRYIFGINKGVDEWSSLTRDLDDSKARYMELVQLLPAILLECDETLSITFMNDSGLDTIGTTMSAVQPLRLTEIVSPVYEVDLLEWIQDATQRAMQARLEVEVLRSQQSSYRALLTASALPRNGAKKGYLVVLVDLTDQKVVQDRLSKLSLAVEQSPSLVLITDKSGHIEYVNPRFSRLTGFSSEEAIGRTPRILKSGVVPEETYRTMWNTILAGEEWRTEILNRRKDGETYWQRSVISPLYDENGDITHFLEEAEDITREKELESELFQSQKMEAIGHLAGGIAHDFNNMLTVIMGVGEMLQERLTGSDDLIAFVDSILSAARKSASLTHQLLAFSRKQLLHPERIDVNVVIKDAEKLLRRIVGDNIRIVTSFQENLGYALLDQSQVHQIVLNLVVNSREAIVGSGTITIVTERFVAGDELFLSSGKLPRGTYVRLTISDTGSGMDEETISHVFEPFYTTKSTGTGLGLATVYGIVQQSNGQIDLQSKPNEGTIFSVYFPLTAEEANKEKVARTKASVGTGSETVLVVEDEEAVRRFVRDVLTDHGFTVLLSESAEHAEERWADIRDRVDILLTDVVLPQKDGVHLYRSLREMKHGLPVVFMSGYTEDSSTILLEIADGRFLLPKPFGADQLITAIRRVLDETKNPRH
ncbi:MAG TPA: PAS domain-containing protein [Spirochaetia bacterium]|nr:PAS domain-containing protein [Spirochaetia bacterium]